jgi:hypothetical protein
MSATEEPRPESVSSLLHTAPAAAVLYAAIGPLFALLLLLLLAPFGFIALFAMIAAPSQSLSGLVGGAYEIGMIPMAITGACVAFISARVSTPLRLMLTGAAIGGAAAWAWIAIQEPEFVLGWSAAFIAGIAAFSAHACTVIALKWPLQRPELDTP